MPTLVTLPDFRDSLQNAGGAGARTAAELSDERLDAALDSAEGEVIGILSRDFTLPAQAEGVLVDIILGIAGYVATLEFFGSQPLEDRDPVVLRYQRAQALLKRIATGQLEVKGIEPDAGASPSGEPAIYQGAPAVNLTNEAPAPTYGGMWQGETGGWHGGGLSWG